MHSTQRRERPALAQSNLLLQQEQKNPRYSELLLACCNPVVTPNLSTCQQALQPLGLLQLGQV